MDRTIITKQINDFVANLEAQMKQEKAPCENCVSLKRELDAIKVRYERACLQIEHLTRENGHLEGVCADLKSKNEQLKKALDEKHAAKESKTAPSFKDAKISYTKGEGLDLNVDGKGKFIPDKEIPNNIREVLKKMGENFNPFAMPYLGTAYIPEPHFAREISSPKKILSPEEVIEALRGEWSKLFDLDN